MSEPAIQVFEHVKQNGYVSLGIATAVVYDYILTFPSEVKYIWNQRWSWVSFLYVLVRYLGCCCAIAMPFYAIGLGSDGPLLKTYVACYTIYTLNQFMILFFLAAADLVMILRVWVMYGRSRLILGILLMIYIPQILVNTVVFIDLLVFYWPLPNPLTCIEAITPDTSPILTVILQFIPGAVTCILIVIQFARQSLQMYRTTKQWQLNQYMNLLSREGIVYFLITLAFSLVNLPTQHLFDSHPVKWFKLSVVLVVASNVPVFALTPRFILSIRALYARDLRGRRGYGIDTGFGLSSTGNSDACATAMVFADVGRSEDSEQDQEIPTDEGGIQLTRRGSRC